MEEKSLIKLSFIFSPIEELNFNNIWSKSNLNLLEFDKNILCKRIKLLSSPLNDYELITPKIFTNTLKFRKSKLSIKLTCKDISFFSDFINTIIQQSRNHISDIFEDNYPQICNWCYFSQYKINFQPNYTVNIKGNMYNQLGNIIDPTTLISKDFWISGTMKFYILINRNIIEFKMMMINPICIY
jgi:hypothetical protein